VKLRTISSAIDFEEKSSAIDFEKSSAIDFEKSSAIDV